MILNVDTATVGVSAATETGIGAGLAAAASAALGAINAATPMGADLDSVEFAAALNAAGAAYTAVISEHVIARNEFAVSQGVASVTYLVTDAISNAALAL